MTTLRKRMDVEVSHAGLADDEVEVIMSTEALARDGHVLEPQGCVLDNYRRNNIWLWSHNPDVPTGNGENVTIGPDGIRALVKFAPLGISPEADKYNRLVKAGVVKAVSIGFDILDAEPLDPKKPKGGQRVHRWELLEASWVSVPADTGALVTARANGDKDMAEWKVGTARDLPIEDSDEWDGPEAQKSIFEWAGSDDFSPAKARKGFLVYDASAPELRGSYKLPIAHVVDGELKVPKGAIRAAASRLPQTDIPDDIKERAGAVLDHYKKEAGIGDDAEDGDRSARRPRTRAKRARALRGRIVFKRGLYEVAQLAYVFEGLGYQVDSAKWEAALEGDESKVPGMLASILSDLGEALCAMTEEEVAEALARRDIEPEDEDDDDELVVEEREHIAAAKSPLVRAFRRGLAHAKVRSGKTLSAETVRCLREAQAAHEDAMELHRSAMKKHREGITAVGDMMDRAGVDEDESETQPGSQTVQTSAGTEASEGSENGRMSADYRRRQAEALALSAVH